MAGQPTPRVAMMNPTRPDDLDCTDRLPAIESEDEGDVGTRTDTWTPAEDPRLAELRATLEARDAEIAELTEKLSAALSAALAASEAEATAAHQAETIAVDDDGSLAQRVATLTTELARRDDRIRMLESDLAVQSAALEAIRRGLGLLSGLKARDTAPGTSTVASRWLVRLDDGSSRVHELKTAHCTVGRTPDNDIQVPEAFMSRCHAVLELDAESATVEDQGSTNGVYVNNLRVRREQLKDGDLVSFGKAHFRFNTRRPGN